MNRIKILDQRTIDKIAAGEVVERPASVAKELIENAFDSGATAITVEIGGGGIDLIRVTDNGSGIDAADVRAAFLRHATSKLTDIDDLYSIRSLGFRGEALSSISAVSRVELITRTKESLTAVHYVIEGGAEKEFSEIGAPAGTTVIMRNLFFNTPARAKFLKTPHTEGAAIAALVEQLALSHPDVSIEFINNRDSRLFTSGNGDLKETVFSIYGRALTAMLSDVSYSDDLLTVNGYAGRPEAGRGSRAGEMVFVNGRFVKDKIISGAAEEAYKGSLMQHRFPFIILNIEIDTRKVDVNVHPSKMNVKFSDREAVYESVRKAVKEALERGRQIPYVEVAGESVKNRQQASGAISGHEEQGTRGEEGTRDEQGMRTLPATGEQGTSGKQGTCDEKRTHEEQGTRGEQRMRTLPAHGEPFEKKRAVKVEEAVTAHQMELAEIVPEAVKEPEAEYFAALKRNIRMVGRVFDTYILAEEKDDFYIIDQHAAHEKVMYEKFMASLKDKTLCSQQLLPAKLVHFSPAQQDAFEKKRGIFEELGFEIEEFGGSEYRVTAVPYHFHGIDPETLFTEVLDSDAQSGRETEEIVREKVVMRACKAAVKANMRLSDEEARTLIDELFSLEDPYRCPHGRPAIVKMSRYEMDKKFKRIV